MKKTWVEPKIEVQKFVPQEYASNACVTGRLACAIPGSSPFEIDDGTGARDFNLTLWWNARENWEGWDEEYWGSPDYHAHGICGETTEITFSSVDGTGSGYEMNHGELDTSRIIYDLTGYELVANTNQYVIWKSQQTGSNKVYKHYGILSILNIDNDRPNHS